MFEPELLPESYQGGSAFAAESTLADDLAATLDQASGAERDALLPYLYAPFYAGSWWDLRQQRLKSEGARQNTVTPKNLTGEILESWQNIDTADATTDQLEEWSSWLLTPVAATMTWTMESSSPPCTYQGDKTWSFDSIIAEYDQLLLRNFVIQGPCERTVVANISSPYDREVTEVVTGQDCGDDFNYPLGLWLEIPHGFNQARISNDGGRIDVVYQEDEYSPVFELHLVARR